jgi:hypothetical protein
MKLLTLAAAISLAAALAACDRNAPNPTPAPKTSAAPSGTNGAGGSSSAGASAPVRSSVNNGSGNSEDNRNGSNPVQGQVDPNQAEQHRDFQQRGDAAGPKSPDTAPMTRNK